MIHTIHLYRLRGSQSNGADFINFVSSTAGVINLHVTDDSIGVFVHDRGGAALTHSTHAPF